MIYSASFCRAPTRPRSLCSSSVRWMPTLGSVLLLAVLALMNALPGTHAARRRLSEPERVAEWHKRHTWPPTWQPETEGYRALMEFRELEIMNMTGADERWENWNQYVQGRLVPALTENGYMVAKMPPAIFAKLKAAVDEGLQRWDSLRTEGKIDVIYNSQGLLPKFVDMHRIAHEVMRDVLPLHEAWAGGIKLRPTSAYGTRFYQNGSSLTMHHDKIETHVISSITHIAHEYDDDNVPWPIEIENHRTGELVSVVLEPGDMLFYESAKCLHGRMSEFKGKYYGSIFIHYQPVDKAVWNFSVDDVIEAIPPHWRDGIKEERGSGWAGCSITTESRRVANAPPRGEFENNPRSPMYKGPSIAHLHQLKGDDL